MASVADEQLARTKTINMRHVYVIGVIALAPTRVPAGENGTSPIPLYPAYTDLSFAFNLRPILTSFSYYDFRLTLLEGKKIIIFLLLLFSSFETNATETERNGTERKLMISDARSEKKGRDDTWGLARFAKPETRSSA